MSFEKLAELLNSGLFRPKNKERVGRIFYDAAKIIYERQQASGKPQLKMKEISSALLLADFHHSQAYRFEAIDGLAELFGECTEADALDYYDNRVMGKVSDFYGRVVNIDEDGMRSLYKDSEGKHTVSTENYEEGRGKRLPWIRHTIQNSQAIYVGEEMHQGVLKRAYLHTAMVTIPLQAKKAQLSYYVVVIRETKNKELRFVTAYSMFKPNKFLRIIAPTKPYGQT